MTPPPPGPSIPCPRPQAQKMRIRLAKARVNEVHSTDLGMADPAALMVIIGRLTHTVEDLLDVLDEGCSSDS